MIAGYRPRYKEGFRRVDSENRTKAEMAPGGIRSGSKATAGNQDLNSGSKMPPRRPGVASSSYTQKASKTIYNQVNSRP